MPTVTIKGQVTIPKKIREAMGIKHGMKVNFELEDGRCFLKKQIEIDPFSKWAGFLDIEKKTDEIIEELRGKAE